MIVFVINWAFVGNFRNTYLLLEAWELDNQGDGWNSHTSEF